MKSHIGTLKAQSSGVASSHIAFPVQFMALADIAALGLCLIAMVTLQPIWSSALTSPAWGVFSLGALTSLLYLNTTGQYRLSRPLSDTIGVWVGVCAMNALVGGSVIWVTGHGATLPAVLISWAAACGLVIAMRYALRAILQGATRWRTPVTVLAPQSQSLNPNTLLPGDAVHGLTPERCLALEPFAALSDEALAIQAAALAKQPVFLAPDISTQPIASRLATAFTRLGATFYYQPAIGVLSESDSAIMALPPHDGVILAVRDAQTQPVAHAIKRAFDLCASIAALVFLAPALLFIAALVRRDGGPVFFEQARLGRNGQVFNCLKFRTMHVQAEAQLQTILAQDPERAAEWAAFQKLSDDPRITAVGRFLRRTSLDELPQLLNIIHGDMSLVGPRPMTLDQMDAYGADLPTYKRLRPGVTGLWQVNGRNTTTFEERARLDSWYARNWSLWRDMVILVRTVREVLFASGR